MEWYLDNQGLHQLAALPNARAGSTGGNCMAVEFQFLQGSLIFSNLHYTGGDISYWVGDTWAEGENDTPPYHANETPTYTPQITNAENALNNLHYVMAHSTGEDARLQEITDAAMAYLFANQDETLNALTGTY